MRAAVLQEFGRPLSVEEVPEPEAGEGQSVLDVKAAGINFADVLIRNGQYPQPPELPTILGNEVAGDPRRPARDRVRTPQRRRLRGAHRRRRRVGLRPAGRGELRRGRGPADDVLDGLDAARPARADPPRLAACSSPPRPAASARPRSRSRVFCGATITAAAGSEEKRELARRLGAQRTITYDEIADLDDIDVALDPVGGKVFADCLQALRPLGLAIGIGFAGGAWEPVDPARLVGRNVGVLGFYLGRLMGLAPGARARGGVRAARAVAARRDPSGRGRRVPARAGERGARPDRLAASRPGRSSLFPETALVTGAAGGIGRAIVSALEAEGAAVRGLDLVDGFDVSDPVAWIDVEPADLVCLNAGVLAAGRRHARRLPAHRRSQRRRRRLRCAGARAADAAGQRLRRHRVAGGLDPDGVRPALRADEARGRRLCALDGAGARAARDPDQPDLPRDRADADDRERAGGPRRQPASR